MKDMYYPHSPVLALAAQVLTADADGVDVDLQGYEGAQVIAVVGASGDTLSGSVYVELEVEESDDGVTYTDVADADLVNVVAGTNDGTFAKVDDPAEDDAVYHTAYIGAKRYIRVVANLTGTHTNGIPVGVLVNRGHGRHQNT